MGLKSVFKDRHKLDPAGSIAKKRWSKKFDIKGRQYDKNRRKVRDELGWGDDGQSDRDRREMMAGGYRREPMNRRGPSSYNTPSRYSRPNTGGYTRPSTAPPMEGAGKPMLPPPTMGPPGGQRPPGGPIPGMGLETPQSGMMNPAMMNRAPISSPQGPLSMTTNGPGSPPNPQMQQQMLMAQMMRQRQPPGMQRPPSTGGYLR